MLGGIDAMCVVVGAIIGVGIFFTPSRVAHLAGGRELALVAWGLAGGVALLGALTFAGLGGRYNRAGAQYEALRDAYGGFVAFIFVFCNATAVQAGAIGIISVVCVEHTLVAAGGDGAVGGLRMLGLAGLLIGGVTLANVVGVRCGAGIQNVTVAAKVLTLLAVAALGALGEPAPAAAATGRGEVGSLGIVGGVLAAMVPAFFSYGGWQHALWISGEVRDPEKNLARAIVGGVAVVVAVYLLTNWAYLRLLGVGGVAESGTLAADVVATAWPGEGRRIVAAAVAVSALGVLNAQLLSGPRLVYAMARDGRFFSLFAGLSRRFGTPAAAIVFLGVSGLAALAAAAAAGPDEVGRLLAWAVFVDSIFFALTGAALLVLRSRTREEDWPVGVPAYPLAPLLFVVGTIGVMLGACMDPRYSSVAYVGAAWIAVGAVLYWAMFRRR